VVEYLPSKQKAPNLNTSSTKNKNLNSKIESKGTEEKKLQQRISKRKQRLLEYCQARETCRAKCS
jgi:hypothetical protein